MNKRAADCSNRPISTASCQSNQRRGHSFEFFHMPNLAALRLKIVRDRQKKCKIDVMEGHLTEWESLRSKCNRGRADSHDLSVVAARPRHSSVSRADPPRPSPELSAHECSLNDLTFVYHSVRRFLLIAKGSE